MALHTLFALAATMTANHMQDPSMDLQIAMPVSDPLAATAKTSRARTQNLLAAPTQGSPVIEVQGAPAAPAAADFVVVGTQAITTPISVSFTNVVPAEVLEWMQKQDVNFVINDGDIAAGTKVTLNLKNVPLDSALDAFASALGGYWERQDRVRIFHRGQNPRFLNPLAPFGTIGLPAEAPRGAMPFDGEKFAIEMQKFGEDMAKFADREALRVDTATAASAAKMAEGQALKARDLAKRQEATALKLESLAKIRSGQALDEKKLAEMIEKATKAAAIDMKAFGTAKGLPGTIKLQGMPSEAYVVKVGGEAGSTSADIDKLLKSLTIEQKDKQEKQGYLKYNDLTKQQKSWLGMKPSSTPGSWRVTLKVNGRELTIQN